jgi:hypothetical protein
MLGGWARLTMLHIQRACSLIAGTAMRWLGLRDSIRKSTAGDGCADCFPEDISSDLKEIISLAFVRARHRGCGAPDKAGFAFDCAPSRPRMRASHIRTASGVRLVSNRVDCRSAASLAEPSLPHRLQGTIVRSSNVSDTEPLQNRQMSGAIVECQAVLDPYQMRENSRLAPASRKLGVYRQARELPHKRSKEC